MESYRQTIEKKVYPVLQKQLGIVNVQAVPRVKSITVGSGITAKAKDGRLQDIVVSTLSRITGQKPVLTKAKKSVSGFKVRENMIVGAKVTLRGRRMYDFMQKLINATLPRVRDFRGLSPKSVDARGNLSIGFKEHLSFPEIRSDEIEMMHGLQVVLTTNAATKERGLALFSALGFPFTQS